MQHQCPLNTFSKRCFRHRTTQQQRSQLYNQSLLQNRPLQTIRLPHTTKHLCKRSLRTQHTTHLHQASKNQSHRAHSPRRLRRHLSRLRTKSRLHQSRRTSTQFRSKLQHQSHRRKSHQRLTRFTKQRLHPQKIKLRAQVKPFTRSQQRTNTRPSRANYQVDLSNNHPTMAHITRATSD